MKSRNDPMFEEGFWGSFQYRSYVNSYIHATISEFWAGQHYKLYGERVSQGEATPAQYELQRQLNNALRKMKGQKELSKEEAAELYGYGGNR